MFSFGNPQYLYLAIIILVFAALYMLAQKARARKISKFGRMTKLEHLAPMASKYVPNIKFIIQMVIVALIVVAMGRPRVVSKDNASTDTETVSGLEIMLCVDVSNSMLASATDDPGAPSRMQKAKLLIERMLSTLTDDKVGLIVFAGEAYTQVPITSDIVSAKMFVNSLNPGMVPTQGTAIGTALDMAANSFTPDSPFEKAIILVTDAENFEDDAVGTAKSIADNGIQIDVIGMGSTNGVPIPIGKSNEKKYLLDNEGNPVKTALNENEAKQIAEAGKGIYINGAESNATTQLHDQLSKLAKTEYERQAFSPESEQFPVFIWIAMALLIIDIFLPNRKIIWLTKYTFFKK